MEQSTLGLVTVHLITDSTSLFDIISKGSCTSENRIMLEVYAAREAQKKETSNIGFVRSSENLANGLTKRNMQKALLDLPLNGKSKLTASNRSSNKNQNSLKFCLKSVITVYS